MSRAVIILALLCQACGYSVVTTQNPFGMHRIALTPFQEDTPAGLSSMLAEELAELLASGGVRLTLSRENAEGHLTGVIKDVAAGVNPTSGAGSARSYQVIAVIEATLEDKSGETVWKTKITLNEDFLAAPAADPSIPVGTTDEQAANRWERVRTLATDTNRRVALHRLAREAARQLYERLILMSATSPQGAT